MISFFSNLSSYFWVFLLLTRFSFFSLASSLFLLWGCRQSPESLRSQDLSATREVRYCGQWYSRLCMSKVLSYVLEFCVRE